MKAFIAIANDPLLCYEDANLTYKALTSPNLEFVASKDFYMSPSTKLADLIFPSADWSERCTYDEELDGNMLFTFDQAVEAPDECKDDWWFFLQWGKRIKPEDWPWANEKEMVLWRFKTFYNLDMTWEEFQSEPFRNTDPSMTATGEIERKRYETGGLRPDGKPGSTRPPGAWSSGATPWRRLGTTPFPTTPSRSRARFPSPSWPKEYPLIASTGFRVYSFFHSAWTNIPSQRKLYPDPFALIHRTTRKTYGITDGEWVTISSPRGKIISKALITRETKKGVVCIPRAGWRDECPELGLPATAGTRPTATSWFPPNPASRATEPPPMRSSLCKIEAGRGDL